MEKKTVIKLVGIVVVVTLLVIMGVNNNKDTKSSENTVTIGAMAPLTGQLSVLGERMRNGMELAHADIENAGIVSDLEIIYEDACDSKTSLNATRKLVDADKVDIIASSFCLFGIDPVVPVTEGNEVIFFNTAANPETVLNKDFVFSTNFTIANDAEKMAQFIVNELGGKTAAMIQLDSSFGESYRDNFKKSFEQLGGELAITEAKLPTATDFRTELTKIKAADPDVLIIIHFGSSMGNAVRQARELGLDTQIIGDYESEDTTVLEFAGEAAEGMIISSSAPAKDSAEAANFRDRYMEKYGEMPDVLATNAYDAVMLSVSNYADCSQNVQCTKTALENVSGYEGVSGNITINADDHSVEKPNIFKIVKDGQFVELR